MQDNFGDTFSKVVWNGEQVVPDAVACFYRESADGGVVYNIMMNGEVNNAFMSSVCCFTYQPNRGKVILEDKPTCGIPYESITCTKNEANVLGCA